MTDALKTALVKFANQDLAIARKEGSMAIVDTKLGAMFISYNKQDRTYAIRAGNAVSDVIVNKAMAVKMIVYAYKVEEA
jgi:hypothetical protein